MEAGGAYVIPLNHMTMRQNLSSASSFSNAGNAPFQSPFIVPNLLTNVSLTWNYTTVPQMALDNRILPYQRGRVLGGSSAISEFP